MIIFIIVVLVIRLFTLGIAGRQVPLLLHWLHDPAILRGLKAVYVHWLRSEGSRIRGIVGIEIKTNQEVSSRFVFHNDFKIGSR